METKPCSKCQEDRPADEFIKNDRRCRPCRNAYRREWERLNPGKAAEGRRRWREANPETLTAARKKWREDNKEKLRDDKRRDRLAKFGLTPQVYDELLAMQGGVCAICKETCPTGRNLAVDHDHACCPGNESCGVCVRGLLCYRCNTAIGHLGDSAQIARSAADYLEQQQR